MGGTNHMKEFLEQNGGLLQALALVLIAVMSILSGLSKALEIIKDKTASNVDNKIYEWVNKAASALKVVVDWISGNRAH